MSSFASSMRLKKKSSSSATSSGASASAALFPLPDGFFPKITLEREQIQLYEHQMQSIVRDALVAYERHEAMGDRPAYGEPWRWLSSVEALTAVQCPQSSRGAPKPTKTRIFGRVNGDYRQQMDFFYAETGKELFDWNNTLFRNTVDAAVLCNIHTAGSRGAPCTYMGIKWVCVAAPRILKRKRDQCFLEYIVHTTDLRGRNVAVRVDLPIDVAACPPLSTELNVKRVKTHSVMILRAATASTTDVFFMTETDPSSSYSSAGYYKRLMTALKDMALCVDAHRISQQTIRDRDEWVPRTARDACATCKRAFTATRRHHHCRLCGEVICGSCAIVRMARRRGCKTPQKTKVCLQCVTAIRASDSAVDLAAAQTQQQQQQSSLFKRTAIDSVSSCATSKGSRHDSLVCDSDVETSEYWDSDSELDGRSGEWSGGRSSSVRSASFDGDFDPDLQLTSSSSSGSISTAAATQSESSVTRDKLSFAATLDVMSEDHCDDFSSECLDESDAEDVTEVLDTKQMAKASSLLSALPEQSLLPPIFHASPVAAAMGCSSSTASRTSSRCSSRSGSTASVDSLRSIDRCLAEQEELLKRMVLVASKCRTASAVSVP